MNDKDIQQAAELILRSDHTTAFTGAGISQESGIPPFRGEDGIWSKYDPNILSITNFMYNAEGVWPLIVEIFYDFFAGKEPNRAHQFLAYLEKTGLLEAVITQNIDNLHQMAGSKEVIEYHGNAKWLICPHCKKEYPVEEKTFENLPPRCPDDHTILKPDFIFFGEPIPEEAARKSNWHAEKCQVMILVGTTGEVMPASMVPRMAKSAGAKIIEINTEPSLYTRDITDLFLQGRAGTVSEKLEQLLKKSQKSNKPS